MLNLREYQVKSLESLRNGFRAGHSRQILYMPTGGGKTEASISLLVATEKKGFRAVMIMDRRVLVDQTSARLDKYGIDHGVLMAGHWRWRPHEKIQICSAQTLEKCESLPDWDLVIIDECHAVRKKITDFIKNSGIRSIGLTASPFTKGLGSTYEHIVCDVTTNDLVSSNQLVPLKVFIAKEIDMTGAKKVAGEWSQNEATERGIKITGDIVTEWVKKTHEFFDKPEKTILFCAGVAHGADLQNRFNEAGYNFISISYKDDDDYKRDVIKEFSKPDSTITGLIATDILTKGFDCIAEGSMVLTDKGRVAIDKLSLDDKIWDGVEFVNHGGAIFKGYQNVITYAGLTATKNHKVKTKYGWISFGECAKEEIEIIQTEINGKEVQESCGYVRGGSGYRKERWENESSLQMSGLQRKFIGFFKRTFNPAFSWVRKMQGSCVAGFKMQKHEKEVRRQGNGLLQKLWRTWDRVSFQFAVGCRDVDIEEYRDSKTRQKYSDRQDRQQRALRAWESTLGNKTNAILQYSKRRVGGKDAQIQDSTPRNKICRQNYEESVGDGLHGSNDNREIQQKVRQTKRRVWDILNAGQRNCFTCEGLLVHNCADVKIGVSARPFTKSFSSHVQQMGRVMRSHPGKDFSLWLCIAKGSRVLTDQGLIPIDKVTKSHKIWDGANFVNHGGAVCNGIQEVITYQGLTATAGHIVHTTEGWRTFGECANKQIRITQTGVGRNPIRIGADIRRTSFLAGRKAKEVYSCFLRMRVLWISKFDFFIKFAVWKNKRMQVMQSAGPNLSNVALQQSAGYESKVLFKIMRSISSLRRTGDRVQIFWGKARDYVDYGKSRFAEVFVCCGKIENTIRQSKPKWTLRTWEFALAIGGIESAKQAWESKCSKDAQIQDRLPGYFIFRQHIEAFLLGWHDSRTNSGKIQKAFNKTKREVWDILDAGQNNCFTCEGLLVHNCHSGNYLRFLGDWDDLYHNGVSELDDGKEKPKPEPTEKEKEAAKCPKCSALWPSKSDICSNCGHVRVRKNEVAVKSGELVEIGAPDKKEKYDLAYKESFYRQLLRYAKNKGYKEGWAFWKYKEKFGVSPVWKKIEADYVSTEVNNYIISLNIKNAYRRRA